MKKYIFGSFMALTAMLSFTACSEDEGTEPGNDKSPAVTIYQYEAQLPYNSDNDASIRVVGNNKVEAAYYLVETAEEYEARVAELGEAGYNQYVVENGVQLEFDEDTRSADVVVTDLLGKNYITVVAKAGNTLKANTTIFNGIVWEDVTEGIYYFQNSPVASVFGAAGTYTTLQVNADDENSYRLKDVDGPGHSLKFTLLPDYQAEDEDGVYTYFRVAPQATGLEYGSYGAIGVRDIGYWQGDDAFVTSYGYESGMYEDGYCFLFVQYYVSAGNLGYQYDYFVPVSDDEGEEVKAFKAAPALKGVSLSDVKVLK